MIEVAGPEHRVLRVNDAFCRLVDAERETLLGRPVVEIVPAVGDCGRLLDHVRETGRFEAHQVAGAAGDGNTAPDWLFAMWPAFDAEARPAGVVIQISAFDDTRGDIAAMNEALLISALHQHELREASEAANAKLEVAVEERTRQLRESVAQLEAFSYSLAHDLRAPVRAIQGFAQLAMELPGAPDWEGTDLVRRMALAAARMEALIQDVLKLSQVASLPMALTRIDAEAMIRELAAERPELAPGQAEFQVEAPLPAMLGHEGTFRQCLANLLDNAAKFVRPGERARIRVWAERKAGKGRAVVRLWVEDDGIGIAEEHREKIFEIFERLAPAIRYAGTGIGLAIVQKAIRRMGGSVGVEPGRPRGSRFWLELAAG